MNYHTTPTPVKILADPFSQPISTPTVSFHNWSLSNFSRRLRATILFVFLLLPLPTIAQESRFFMPIEIAKAYENGTRSYDGKPGPNYWHNTVDYKIDVTILPEEKMINGHVLSLIHI